MGSPFILAIDGTAWVDLESHRSLINRNQRYREAGNSLMAPTREVSLSKLATILIAAALVLAACGGSSDPAAVVNGETITVSDLTDLSGGDDASDDIIAQALGTLVQWSIVRQAAADEFGIEPTPEEIDEQITEVLAQTGAPSLEELAASQGASEDLLRRYIVQLFTQDAVTEKIGEDIEPASDDDVSNAVVQSPETWTTVCAAHLLVETESEATDALARIAEGDDFATVAQEVSIDTNSAIQGGDLGCSQASAYVEPFAAAVLVAEIDTPTDPVESEFGFHVIVVSERTEATLDEVKDALTNEAINAATDDWFRTIMEAAVVEVSDGFGTWVTDPAPAIVIS